MTMRFWPVTTRRVSHFVMAAVFSVFLCSCSAVLDPYITPTGTEPSGTAPDGSSFSVAVSYARGTVKMMEDRLGQLEHYDVGTGLLMSASGVVGLGFAAFGAHSDALVGAGLAGGTAFGARSFLPIQDRKMIYAKGASAITCAISALSFSLPHNVTNALPNTLSEARAPVSVALLSMQKLIPEGSGAAQSDSFQTAMSAFSLIGSNRIAGNIEAAPSLSMGARLAVKQIGALQRSELRAVTLAQKFTAEATSTIEARGERLIAATEAIRQAVNVQLIEARADPDAAMAALQTKSEEHTKSLRESYEKLQAAVQGTRNEAEATSNVGEAVNAEAQHLNLSLTRLNTTLPGRDGDNTNVAVAIRNAGTAAEHLATAVKESKQKTDEIISYAAQILEIVDLESTCLSTL